MMRMIDVEVEEKRIRINFPYQRDLVDLVRTLPERWYDNRSRSWFVPLQHLAYVLHRLEGHQFKHSSRLRAWQEQEGEGGAVQVATPRIPPGTLTISGLNQAAHRALQERFQEPVWLVGELQDYDKNLKSSYRTFFFDLVERPIPGAAEVARVKAVLFEKDRGAMEEVLEKSGLSLRDGVSVRVCGRVELYPKQGSFQVVVKEIDPTYTAGELELNRERVYQVLMERGIEGRNLERKLPICPLRVGLITSYESDAYNDFVHQLRQSGFGFSVTVRHANVQGANTERSVLKGLSYFQKRAKDFDVVAIVRGGGSRSDLAYFDTEAIGEAVCLHPVKVICGVGHQRDTCLLDLISDSTKTPTAAAALLVEAVDEYRRGLDEVYQRIARSGGHRLERGRERLFRSGMRLERGVTRRLGELRRTQGQLERALQEAGRRRLREARRELEGGRRRLSHQAEQQVSRKRFRVERVEGALSLRRILLEMERAREGLQREEKRLERGARQQVEKRRRELSFLTEELNLLDPRRVLERGFALIRGAEGAITSVDQLLIGESFEVELADGVFRARREDQNETKTKESGDKE